MSDLKPKKLLFNLDDFKVDEEGVVKYEEERKKQEEEQKYRQYKIYSGVPAKFFDSSIDTYLPQNEVEDKIKQTVIEFIKNPKNRVLIFSGNNGNGKTHLGCAAIRELAGKYLTASDLCIEYDSCGSYNSKLTRTGLLRELYSYSLLVIDECGKYTLNPELEKFLLANIISSRYERNLPTILITNAKKKEFVEFLGKSVFDRLTEVCTTIEFNGESKRSWFRK